MNENLRVKCAESIPLGDITDVRTGLYEVAPAPLDRTVFRVASRYRSESNNRGWCIMVIDCEYVRSSTPHNLIYSYIDTRAHLTPNLAISR